VKGREVHADRMEITGCDGQAPVVGQGKVPSRSTSQPRTPIGTLEDLIGRGRSRGPKRFVRCGASRPKFLPTRFAESRRDERLLTSREVVAARKVVESPRRQGRAVDLLKPTGQTATGSPKAQKLSSLIVEIDR
jgi:hypothetical protein